MTSPLLIVLANREGSHWVLAVLLFILRLWPHTIWWEWGNLMDHLHATLGFGYSHSSFPSESAPISVLHSLEGGFYLALVSAKQGMIFNPLGRLLSPCMMSLYFWYLGYETAVQQDMVKIYLFHIPSPGVA